MESSKIYGKGKDDVVPLWAMKA